MEKTLPQCARCTVKVSERICLKQDGQGPDFCPTQNCGPVIQEALGRTRSSECLEFARQASIQEGEGYGGRELGYAHVRPIKTRIEETIELARKMTYKRLGLVFCIGLRQEARVVEKLLRAAGFEVVSVACKLGCIPKEEIGVRDNQKISIGEFESMCNPVAQAYVLNQAKTEFNVVMGLCVGHDSLFLKHSDALCTVLAAKDRLLGHNPLAAVYTVDTYYRALK
jgi:uncharacterized metal-binding protein